MNETIRLIEDRKSLRRYADREIPEKLLNQVIHSAMRAPTAGNMMMYSIIVIKDQDIKNTLSETCDHQPFIAKAPVLLLFLADVEKWHRYFLLSDVLEYEKKRAGQYEFPTMADLMLGISDALIAAQTAVITAESLGLGTCYIGDIMENYEIHSKLLNLPKRSFPIGLLTLGYPVDGLAQKKTDRFDPAYIVSQDRYQVLEDHEILKMFKDREGLFKEDNPYKAQNYAQMFYGRKCGSDFMMEMNRSIGEMLKNWTY
jgi:nitroreductase